MSEYLQTVILRYVGCWIFSCVSSWNVGVSEAAFVTITNCLNVHCDIYLSVLWMSSVVVMQWRQRLVNIGGWTLPLSYPPPFPSHFPHPIPLSHPGADLRFSFTLQTTLVRSPHSVLRLASCVLLLLMLRTYFASNASYLLNYSVTYRLTSHFKLM